MLRRSATSSASSAIRSTCFDKEAQMHLVAQAEIRPSEDRPLETGRDLVRFLLPEDDLVDMIGHRMDILEKGAAGSHIRLHGLDGIEQEFLEILMKLDADVGMFDLELPDQPREAVEQGVHVLEELHDVPPGFRNQRLLVEILFDGTTQGIPLVFRIADAGQGLGKGLQVPLQIGVHPVLAQQPRLADLVQKFVDLFFDPDFLLQYALCHFPFPLRPGSGGSALAIFLRLSRIKLFPGTVKYSNCEVLCKSLFSLLSTDICINTSLDKHLKIGID